MKSMFSICYCLFVLQMNLFAQTKYLLVCNSDLLVESRKILLRQVGTLEKSNRNDGSQVENYLKSVGLPLGSPYCVAGQYYCFLVAAKRLSIPTTCIPLPKTGLSLEWFRFAKRNGARVPCQFSEDDLVVWMKTKSINGHTERIVSVGRKGWVETIGFNTRRYDASQHKWVEGVFRWQRNLFHPLGRMNLLGLVGFSRKNNGC